MSLGTMTEDQIRAHLSGAVCADKSYFVEAGAGAGKTRLIVERIVSQLLSGHYQLEEIVAITFTVKSTRELQTRLDKAFQDLCQECQKNGDAARLEKAQYFRKNLGKMQISTIHSFCSTMLSTMPFHGGLDGTMLETRDDKDYIGLIRHFYKQQRKTNPEYFQALTALSVHLKDTEGFFQQICMHNEMEIATCSPADRLALGDRLYGICKELHGLLRDLFVHGQEPYSTTKVTPVVGTAEEVMLHPQLLAFFTNPTPDKEETILAFSLLYSLFHSPLHNGAPGVKAMKEELKKGNPLSTSPMLATLTVLKNFVSNTEPDQGNQILYKSYYPLLQEYVHSHLVEALVPLREAFLEEKQAKKYWTKNDLLSLARDMLANSPQAREYFHQRYRVLYVDEFQDTDPVQTELLFYLTAELALGATLPQDWRQCQPRPGSLFLVGDPKQSIYRFRGADIANYKTVGQLFAHGLGDCVTLHHNYRSQSEICDYVDLCFNPDGNSGSGSPKMPDPDVHLIPSTYQADYVKMQAKRPSGGAIMPYTAPKNVKKHEPAFVAFLIESLIAGHLDYDGMKALTEQLATQVQSDTMKNLKNTASTDKNPPNPYSYKDFLILCLTKKDVEKYVESLAARNIPTLSSGNQKLISARPIACGLAHLNVLAYPDNSITLTHLLVEHYQVALPTIHRFLTLSRAPLHASLFYEDKRQEVLDLLTQSPEDSQVARLCVIGTTLSMMVGKGKYLPPMAVVEWIFDGPCQVWNSVSPQQKELEYSRVQQFLNQLRQSATGNLTDYYLTAQDIAQMDVEYQLALAENSNCVRVMNLHKAKGLEAPVVFLTSNTDSSHPTDSHAERKGNQATLHQCCRTKLLQLAIPPQWTTPVTGWESIENQYSLAERVRLSYVGATRGEDILYVFGGVKNNRWSHLYANATPRDCAKLGKSALAGGFLTPVVPTPPPLTQIDMAAAEANLEQKARVLLTSYRLHISPSKLDKQAPRDSESPEETEEVLVQKKHQPYGPGWGTIIHRMMELSLRHKATDPDSLQQFARQAIYEGFPTETLTVTQSTFFFGKPGISLVERKRKVLANAAVKALSFLQDPESPFLALLSQGNAYPEMSFFTSAAEDATSGEEASLYQHLHQHLQGQKPKAFDVEGYIDLAIEGREGWIVVDYKTDRLLPRETKTAYATRLKSHYKSQIDAYSLLLQTATGKSVVGSYLCSIPLQGELISLD